MINVTVQFGTGNIMTKEFENGTTLGQVLGNSNLKCGLGYGDNVAGHVQGVAQSSALTLWDGAVVVVHTKACEKN